MIVKGRRLLWLCLQELCRQPTLVQQPTVGQQEPIDRVAQQQPIKTAKQEQSIMKEANSPNDSDYSDNSAFCDKC